jgi:DNA-binding MarR family transcriptional regulator
MSKTEPYDLHAGPGYRLTLAARKNQQFFERNLAELGLTRQMWAILISVGTRDITLPGEIAQYIGVNRTSVSRSLRQMEKKKLLQRSDGTDDRRTTHIRLTRAGKQALKTSMPMAQAAQDNLRKRLSETEVNQLSDLLDKLLAGDTETISGL